MLGPDTGLAYVGYVLSSTAALVVAAVLAVASWPLDELAALTLALGASYVAATTVNDISDEEIDKINHPAGRGRPLVHGEATPADLWRLNLLSAGVALAAGTYVGWRGVARASPRRRPHRLQGLISAPVPSSTSAALSGDSCG